MKRLIAASLFAVALTATPALAKDGVKVGVLECDVSAGIGLILGSSKSVDCVFKRDGRDEHCSGKQAKLGV